ncbi:MAG: dihydroorotate dehydrogenase-like protein [Ardenticatenaceae bacterium]|nr:dihydroorotate dehydrogenase-like protein [Ardenticatenaceae bacterium]
MDLSTTYLGLKLKNPLVPSASPLARDIGRLRQLEDAGAAAVVLYSLFAEQFYPEYGRDPAPGTEAAVYQSDPEDYLEHIRRVKAALDIPVIASLNGGTMGAWVQYARQMQEAGADALELNIYFIPADPDMTGAFVEQFYVEILRQVKAVVSMPVAIKFSPYFSSVANMARRLVDAGADGLVMFNRFYQPDLDVENWLVEPKMELSTSSELRLPLRWIAILYGRLQTDFALTTGVHSVTDVLKGLAAGATVTMMASELLKNGPKRLQVIRSGLETWLEQNDFASVAEMRGRLSLAKQEKPIAFERGNYLRVLSSYTPGDSWKYGALGLDPTARKD